MNTTGEQEALAYVRTLEPIIREHIETTERERRVARPVIAAMRSAGLFRLLTPRSLGGLEVEPLAFAHTVEEVARVDSAAAWALCNPNSLAWWCGRLPDRGVDEIYAAGADTIIAAAFHPPVQAIPTAGGYRLSGRRPLASGIHDASWLMLTALVMDGERPSTRDGSPDVVAAFMPARDVEIIDTWDTLGMRGTDSNDVAVEDLFVPASLTYPLRPDAPWNARYQGPLYRMSTMAEVTLIGVPVFLGIARQAIDEFRQMAQGKTPFGSSRLLRDRPAAQAGLARAEALLRAGRGLFHQTVSDDWKRACAGEPHTLEQKADALLAGVHAVDCAVKAVDSVYALAGTTGIYTRNRLERHFRDVHTLRHHGFICESRYETVGQVYLGVPPEFPLVAF